MLLNATVSWFLKKEDPVTLRPSYMGGGGGLLRDGVHGEVRVSSRRRKQKITRMLLGLLAVSLCVGGRLWQLLFRRRTKQAAPSREGRTPSGWRDTQLTATNAQMQKCTHTHTHTEPLSLICYTKPESFRNSVFTLFVFFCVLHYSAL